MNPDEKTCSQFIRERIERTQPPHCARFLGLITHGGIEITDVAARIYLQPA